MTQTTMGPPFIIDGPIPAPPKFRLLDVAQILDVPDPHWGNGAQVYSYPPDLPTVWDPCTLPSSTPRKATGATITNPTFAAYQALLAITCTARGIDPDDIEAYQARALAAFTAVESYAVEKELAGGALMPLNPHFNDSNLTQLASGAAQTPGAGMSYLADAIGATARQGMIHATPGTITGWSREYTVEQIGGVLQNAVGNPVVNSNGLLGQSPTGVAPATGHAWAYATGPVKIVRGPVEILPGTAREALNRSTNVITFRAERAYLVMWDTELQAGVLIDWRTT